MKHEDIDKMRDSLSAVEEAVGWMGDYRAALDELAALRERGRWRPIEEAPKDCTDVLVLFADGRRAISRYGKVSHVSVYGWLDPASEFGDDINCFPTSPTHWLPLPEAPR